MWLIHQLLIDHGQNPRIIEDLEQKPMAYDPERMRRDLLVARVKAAMRNHAGRTPDALKGSQAMKLCQLSQAELVIAMNNQDANCKICQKTLEDNKWVPDHDHQTLLFRGILCLSCNAWLGKHEYMVMAVYAYLRGRLGNG